MPDDTARRLAHLLGLGSLHLFDAASQVRDHDLLVRTRAAESLSEAALALRDLAVSYRQERIPAATREQPYPPPERMATLQRLQAATASLEDLAAKVRAAALPTQDAVWQRLRSANLQYELMLEADISLLEPCRACGEAAAALGLGEAEAPDGLGPLDDALRHAGQALRERKALLAAP